MLIARWVARNRQSCVDDVRWTQTITVGGSSEMLANAFTANPFGAPSCIVVTKRDASDEPAVDVLQQVEIGRCRCAVTGTEASWVGSDGCESDAGHCVSAQRDDAERGEQSPGVPRHLLLHDQPGLAVRRERRAGHLHRAPRRRHPEERVLVRADAVPAHRSPITLDDDVLDVGDQVGKARAGRGDRGLELVTGQPARRHRRCVAGSPVRAVRRAPRPTLRPRPPPSLIDVLAAVVVRRCRAAVADIGGLLSVCFVHRDQADVSCAGAPTTERPAVEPASASRACSVRRSSTSSRQNDTARPAMISRNGAEATITVFCKRA